MYEKELEALLSAAAERNHRATLICHPKLFEPIRWVFERYSRGYYACFRLPTLKPPDNSSVLAFSSFERLLGETVDYMVYEAAKNYEPNSFAALADTVRGGGLFAVVADTSSPPVNPDFESALSVLVPRFVRHIESSDLYAHIDEGGIRFSAATAPKASPAGGAFKTRDQERAYHSALKWFKEGGEILALVSRRGRGKSALMGMLLRGLCLSGMLEAKVYLTSQTPSHLGTLLKHLDPPSLPPLKHWGSSLRLGSVDLVLSHPDSVPSYSTVFVDEASTLPFNTLIALIKRSKRVVLSTTNYGYEGSGRSFQTKLLEEIRRLRPPRRLLVEELSEPARYSLGDPLEQALTATFLFFAHEETREETAEQGPRRLESFDPTTLSSMDEQKLAEIYSALTEAHYRNEPSDLSFLLENGEATTFVYYLGSSVVGVALCVKDGPLEKAKVEAVLRGASFPGDLITERLTARSMSLELAELRGQRVVRIAVKPAYQRRGHGSNMLRALEEHFRGKYDWIGASFSAEPETAAFWFKNGYTFAAISWSTSMYARYPSTICVKPLSERGLRVLRASADTFRRHVLAQIYQKSLETGVYAMIVKSLAQPGGRLEQSRVLAGFAEWNLPAELIVPELSQNLFVLADALTISELESAIRLLRWEASRSDRLKLKEALKRVLRRAEGEKTP